ncbi:MAP1B [Symbiodinium sp. KB8]|nr:MAP1B [Symbiodinium sp. KB8]
MFPFWDAGSDGWAGAKNLGSRWALFMFLLSGSWVGWLGRGKEAGLPLGSLHEAHILEKDKKADAPHLNDTSVQLKKELEARYAGSCAMSQEICDLNAKSAKSVWRDENVTQAGMLLVSSDPTMYCLGAIKVKLDAKADVSTTHAPTRLGSVVRLFGIYADFPNGNLVLTAPPQTSADLLTGDAVTVAAAATRSAGAFRWVFVELPSTDSTDILTKDGERVFFQTQMRDISGSCDVVVTESAALALSGLNATDDFVKMFDASDLRFFPSTVRCLRRVQGDYVNVVLAAAAPMTRQPPSKNTCDLIKNRMQLTSNMCTGCGAAPLHLMQGNAFYNVEVQSRETNDNRIFLHSAVTVVKGLEKSKWALVNPDQPEGACKVSTKVVDILGDGATTFCITGICKASDLLSFKFGRSSVLVRILRKHTSEFIITDLHSVSASEVERTVHALKVWHELLMTV